MQDRKDKREQAWQNKDGAGKAHVPGVGYSTIVGSSGCSISCICLLKEAFGSTASPVLAAARSAARCGAVRLNSCRMFLASWVSLCEAQPPLLCSATMPNAAFGGAPRSPPWAALRNTPPFGVWWGRLEGGSARRRGGEVLANKLAASGKTSHSTVTSHWNFIFRRLWRRVQGAPSRRTSGRTTAETNIWSLPRHDQISRAAARSPAHMDMMIQERTQALLRSPGAATEQPGLTPPAACACGVEHVACGSTGMWSCRVELCARPPLSLPQEISIPAIAAAASLESPHCAASSSMLGCLLSSASSFLRPIRDAGFLASRLLVASHSSGG